MTVDTAALNPLEAHELILAFAAQRGEPALRLALHAAVPQVLRAGLVHLLRLNFVSDAPNDGAAEADVLFAPFCEDIGNGYFRFAENARLLLLRNLDPTYPDEPTPRSGRIGRFLAAWIDQESRSVGPEYDALYSEYLEIERWSALGFLDADAAAAQLADALHRALDAEETVARIRIGGLASALSTPLGRYGRLLAYASGLEAAQAGNAERARDLLEPLGKQVLSVGAVQLEAPSEVLRKYVATRRVAEQPRTQETARESETVTHAEEQENVGAIGAFAKRSRLRIYVSSIVPDVGIHREVVARTLREQGYSAFGAGDLRAGGPPVEQQYALAEVERRDVFVLILGWQYGYVPPDDNPQRRSIVELEYNRARELGKPCLVFLLQPDAAALQAIENDRRVAAFRRQLARERYVWFFTTVDELEKQVVAAVLQLETRIPADHPQSSEAPPPASTRTRPATRAEALAAAYGGPAPGMEEHALFSQMSREMNAFVSELAAAADLSVREAGYFFFGRLGENYDKYPFNWEPFRDFAGPLLRSPDSIPIVMISAQAESSTPPSAIHELRPRPHYRISICPSHTVLDIANVWLETLSDDGAIPKDGGERFYSWFFRNLDIAPERLSLKARQFVNSFPSSGPA